jgi:hypothetical protein
MVKAPKAPSVIPELLKVASILVEIWDEVISVSRAIELRSISVVSEKKKMALPVNIAVIMVKIAMICISTRLLFI